MVGAAKAKGQSSESQRSEIKMIAARSAFERLLRGFIAPGAVIITVELGEK